MASYQLYYGMPVSNSSDFCKANSVISVMSAFNELSYNLYFCYYLYMIIKNPLKSQNWIQKNYHFINLVMTVIFIGYVQPFLGKNLFGTCSVIIRGILVEVHKELLDGNFIGLLSRNHSNINHFVLQEED